jgi:hypothetical protein
VLTRPSKLRAAAQQISNGNNNAAINQLNAFNNEVDAQAGKHITQQAHALLEAAALYLVGGLAKDNDRDDRHDHDDRHDR